MKKKILIGIYIVILLICGKLSFNYIYNAIVIYRYHQYDYSVNVKPLLIFNWSEPYIAYYNQGNIYYNNESFEDAITSYERALKLHLPEKKECAVRINLALAMLGTMDEDYSAPEHVDTSLEILTGARDVLLEKGCATENGDGHSETAEQLKEEIEALIEQLEEEMEENGEAEGEEKSGENGDTEEENESKEAEDAFEDEVKKALQEKQSKANQQRKESLDYYEEFYKDNNFDADGYIW